MQAWAGQVLLGRNIRVLFFKGSKVGKDFVFINKNFKVKREVLGP